jgi:hypothetical protein
MIMCEITSSESDAVRRLTTCNNPHCLRLTEHSRRFYKHGGGVKIPAGAQLERPLQRDWEVLPPRGRGGIMLSSGYADNNRTIRHRYLDALFDDDTVCKGDPAQHVCRMQPKISRYQTLNPWTPPLGNFRVNPYEVCQCHVDFTSPSQGSREYISGFLSLSQASRTRSHGHRPGQAGAVIVLWLICKALLFFWSPSRIRPVVPNIVRSSRYIRPQIGSKK